jgi:hypothetical protein
MATPEGAFNLDLAERVGERRGEAAVDRLGKALLGQADGTVAGAARVRSPTRSVKSLIFAAFLGFVWFSMPEMRLEPGLTTPERHHSTRQGFLPRSGSLVRARAGERGGSTFARISPVFSVKK